MLGMLRVVGPDVHVPREDGLPPTWCLGMRARFRTTQTPGSVPAASNLPHLPRKRKGMGSCIGTHHCLHSHRRRRRRRRCHASSSCIIMIIAAAAAAASAPSVRMYTCVVRTAWLTWPVVSMAPLQHIERATQVKVYRRASRHAFRLSVLARLARPCELRRILVIVAY